MIVRQRNQMAYFLAASVGLTAGTPVTVMGIGLASPAAVIACNKLNFNKFKKI